MITATEETWATTTLRDAQDPGAGTQQWKPLSKITIERFNLIFSQVHSRGYGADGLDQHDAATVLENSLATLFKVALDGGDLKLTKWSQASGLDEDDVTIVADANISDVARPSIELTAGNPCAVRVFYIDEDDDKIHYVNSADGGATFAAEADVGALSNAKAIASVSTARVHCISYASGNTRFHCYDEGTPWAITNSLLYWPHEVNHIDAITIGTRDLIVFYSPGPMFGNYRTGGIYGVWYEHGRWSDLFVIDVLNESDDYSYRQSPMISEENDIYFLTGWLGEGNADYNDTIRFLKTSKDGQHWSQYQPLVTCAEAGPAKLLVINIAAGGSWPGTWSTGQQVYLTGYDKVYESDATRLVGEDNSDVQTAVTSRTANWSLVRGVMAQGNTVLSNHDGVLDGHSIIDPESNTLLLKREAGYRTGAGDEYATLTMEQVDLIRETDRLPKRHKQVVSRDYMAWMRDKKADHYEEWKSQLAGYDNYHDDVATGRGGLSRTSVQVGRWAAEAEELWLTSDNSEGVAFATWGSYIMNGQAKEEIRIETASNGEYAGVIFRARDKGNFWAAYYLETDDKIHLRQKIGGNWQAIVASTGALGWAIDTFYGIMVDFRYSYVRVFYSTDFLTWTQAFVYTIPGGGLTYPLEYGYVGRLAYGYSDETSPPGGSGDVGEEDPGYEPPTPPPAVAPPPVADWSIDAYIGLASGHVIRANGIGPGRGYTCTYENLGITHANGVRWMAIDPFDPDTAMVCCAYRVYKTTNLRSAAPTWTLVLGALGYEINMVRASEIRQGLWMVVGYDATKMYVHWTVDGGVNWSNTNFTSGDADGAYSNWLEMSTHDSDVAWVMWVDNTDELTYIADTDDLWSTETVASTGTCFDGKAAFRPCCHHRHHNNDDDAEKAYGGSHISGAAHYTRIYHDTTCVTLYTDAGANGWCWVPVVGCGWGTENRWWALARDDEYGGFWASDDGDAWTEQKTWTVLVSGNSWPSRDCKNLRGDWRSYVMTRDGTAFPLRITIDRGLTWGPQWGDWPAFVSAEGLGDPDVICVCSPRLVP